MLDVNNLLKMQQTLLQASTEKLKTFEFQVNRQLRTRDASILSLKMQAANHKIREDEAHVEKKKMELDLASASAAAAIAAAADSNEPGPMLLKIFNLVSNYTDQLEKERFVKSEEYSLKQSYIILPQISSAQMLSKILAWYCTQTCWQ